MVRPPGVRRVALRHREVPA